MAMTEIESVRMRIEGSEEPLLIAGWFDDVVKALNSGQAVVVFEVGSHNAELKRVAVNPARVIKIEPVFVADAVADRYARSRD